MYGGNINFFSSPSAQGHESMMPAYKNSEVEMLNFRLNNYLLFLPYYVPGCG